MDLHLLVPAPKIVQVRTGFYAPSRETIDAVFACTASSPDIPAIETVREVPLEAAHSLAAARATARELANQAYEIVASPGTLRITAATAVARFHAIVTLRQLLRLYLDTPAEDLESTPRIPALRVVDWPDIPHRGVMLDISRNRVPTMETSRLVIDILADLKINELQLYTEHTFAYAGHESVWRDASPFTAQEIRELDSYCKERFIELVPNQNSFGHMERWLKHPEYLHLAEAPNGWTGFGRFQDYPYSLSPVVPDTVRFLEGLYDQLLPNFSSSRFNIGCDETIDLGQGRSAELCRREGWANVYLSYLRKLHHLVTERGRTPMFWGDVVAAHPELAPKLPRPSIAMSWGYEAVHSFEREAAMWRDAQIPFYVCPGTSSWNSIAGRWRNARVNIENAVSAARQYGACGVLVADWGDNGHHQQFPVMLPALLYAASLSWGAAENEGRDVGAALQAHYFVRESPAVSAALGESAQLSFGGPALHNATIAAVILMDQCYPYFRDRYEEFAEVDFSALLSRLDDISERIAGDPKQQPLQMPVSATLGMRLSADGTLSREVRLTIDLLRHAVRLSGLRLSGGTKAVSQLPTSQRNLLFHELAPLIDEYRSLWTLRYRPGGLADSAGRLQQLLDSYRS